jgi:hypothetical protein
MILERPWAGRPEPRRKGLPVCDAQGPTARQRPDLPMSGRPYQAFGSYPSHCYGHHRAILFCNARLIKSRIAS